MRLYKRKTFYALLFIIVIVTSVKACAYATTQINADDVMKKISDAYFLISMTERFKVNTSGLVVLLNEALTLVLEAETLTGIEETQTKLHQADIVTQMVITNCKPLYEQALKVQRNNKIILVISLMSLLSIVVFIFFYGSTLFWKFWFLYYINWRVELRD